MPPEETEEKGKQQKGWRKYQNWIYVGVVVVTLIAVGVSVRFNPGVPENKVTLASLSTQIQNIQLALANQAEDMENIKDDIDDLPTTVALDLSQVDLFAALALIAGDALNVTLDKLATLAPIIVDGFAAMRDRYVALNKTVWATWDLVLSLNKTLGEVRVALNIT